jgi:raffinose/stachyose/melibiose transport system permease protein
VLEGGGVRAPWHVLLVFIAPALVIYTALMIYPVGSSLWLAFHEQLDDRALRFVGFDNIIRLFADISAAAYDDRFLNALGNTVRFFLIVAGLQTPLALLLAALLSLRGLKGAALFRTAFFIPATLSLVITGWIWLLMLNPTWGIIDGMLRGVGLSGLVPSGGLLGTASSALNVIALVTVWQFVGLPMILLLAAFLGIDEDLLDAAKIDGGTGWTIFWTVRLPLVLPTVGLVVILTFSAIFVAFDIVFVMQGIQAGPDYATDLLGTLFYRVNFGNYGTLADPTMGTAIATVIFGIIFAVVVIYLTLIRPHLVRV